MSVEELNVLHQRYIEVSDRFKSAWTFHQFLQGLHKLIMEVEFGQHSAEFQAVYDMLKEVSKNLNATSVERVGRELSMVERRLQELNRLMVQEDTKVSPSLLRLFFQRVRNFNEGVIVQLIKFYLFHYQQVVWTQDYNDKVDFLVTKAAETGRGPQGPWELKEMGQLRPIVEGFWKIVGAQEVGDGVVEMHREQIEELRKEMTDVDSFDDLIGRKLVQSYREFKHGLGPLFFQPDVLLAIMETNIELRNYIQTLYRREEQRIVADYQRIFELEQQVPTDDQLDIELADFREDVEKFEKNLQNETLSLQELGRLKERVRHLVPRLTGIRDGEDLFAALEAEEDLGSRTRVGGSPWQDELLVKHQAGLLDALSSIDPTANPKTAVLSPELFAYHLEPREVEAYQAVLDGSDTELDDFVLWAAALRSKIEGEAEDIQGILDDTAVTKEAPVFDAARGTTAMADRFVRTFDHFQDRAILEDRPAEARALQVLRMKMLRSYSGLWLIVHKPSLRA